MSIVLAAALAGLLATPHCAAMCGGFATACIRPHPGLWSWHAGRLLTYAALGALAGGFGDILPGPAWLPALLASLLLLWFAASLAGLTPPPGVHFPTLVRAGQKLVGRKGVASRAVFGALTGLLPCGMVYAVLGIAVAAAQPATGALALLAFGVMTVPGLSVLALGVRRLALRGSWSRRILAALVLASGLWSIGMRGLGSRAATHAHSRGSATPAAHQFPSR